MFNRSGKFDYSGFVKARAQRLDDEGFVSIGDGVRACRALGCDERVEIIERSLRRAMDANFGNRVGWKRCRDPQGGYRYRPTTENHGSQPST